MADTLSGSLTCTLSWLFQDALDLSTISDSSQVQFDKSFADGTSADQCDKLWHDQRTVASAANDDLDMTALTNTIFGSTVTITFVKVKAIIIANTSTTAGDELVVDSSVTNGFLAPFNGSATSKAEIGPDSVLVLSSMKDGWTVTASTADIIRISNPGGGTNITYNIAIIGTSA